MAKRKRESTTFTSQDDAITASPVNKLNYDCLREIFSYLSKHQLIGIERVCKKWEEVALSLWSNETSLTYENIRDITQDFDEFHISHFMSVLKRCKKHLVSLNLKNFDTYILKERESDANAIIFLICMECKNLKHLNVNGGLITKKGLDFLEKKSACMPNLESFDIPYSRTLNDKILESFINMAPKLESLSIGGNSHLTGNGLVTAGRAFKKLTVSFCRRISVETLKKILDNSPFLEVLKGSNKCTFKMLNERPLREHLINLQSYSRGFFKDISELKKILPFPNLRYLELNCDYSTDNEALYKFYKWFPNLEYLNLSENFNEEGKVLNNDGIKALVKLLKLKSLDFFSLEWLTGEALVYLAANTAGRIEIMECANCHQLYDSEMIKFVSLCPKLKYLNVSYCQKITSQFLQGVLDLMHLRTSREPLKIRITDSVICDISQYKKKHPLLVLENFGELESDSDDYFLYDANYDYAINDGVV